MRKLASIQRIISLNKIPDADTIEVAIVLGWKVVVRKDEFQVGDLCIFVEIDSILPDRPEFEFLRSKRIRTVKLRGQVSQGICFPLSILNLDQDEIEDFVENLDITELLNITKYEPPIPIYLSGEMKGPRPWFIPKTDEERIQNIPEVLQHPDAQKPVWYMTEKLDGISCTIYDHEGVRGVCSRNIEFLETTNNTYTQVAREIIPGPKMAIQGEIIGPGIQGNKYKLNKHMFFVFDAFDITAQKYLTYPKYLEVVGAFNLVPLVDYHSTLPITVDEAVIISQGKSKLADIHREGVVIRHMYERVSFKVVNPDFLLRYHE